VSTIREFVTKWGFDVDESELDKLDKGVTRVQKNIQATAKVAVDVGKKMSLGITLPFIAASGASIKFASDAEETLNKFAVVFGDVRSEADETARNLAQNFGLAQDKAQALLADTGDLLSGFGFTGESALSLSKQVQELAVDLASFTNFSGGAEGASQALTKALLGERESVKQLGIAILEEDVKAKVKALEAAGRFTNETERERKAIATLEIALGQSKNAIGDFERSSKSFANQTRILNARIRDVTIQFGQILLPIANKVVGVLGRMVNWFSSLSSTTKTFILIIGGLAAAIGPLLIIAGMLTQAFLNIRMALMLVGSAALKTFAIMLLKFILVAAAVAAVALVFDDLRAYFNGQDSVFGAVLNWIDELLLSFQETFPQLSQIVLVFVQLITAPIQAVVGLVRGLAAALGTLTGGGGFFDSLKAFGSEFGSSFSSLFNIGKGKATTADFLGISGIRKQPGAGVTSPATTNNNSGVVNQTVNSPITVNVPPGTSPQAASAAVQSGVKEALGQQLRETGRQVQTAVAN
jgi:hypothetical protein